jgi:hypothetical protein
VQNLSNSIYALATIAGRLRLRLREGSRGQIKSQQSKAGAQNLKRKTKNP